MCREQSFHGAVSIVAIVGVTLCLLFVNLYGSTDPRPGTLSQRKWVHGWPLTWLSRTWRPFTDDARSELGVRRPCWPWVYLPGDRLHLVALGVLGDAVVAGVVLVGLMSGLCARRATRPFQAGFRAALMLLVFLAVAWVLATLFPRVTVFLANACVYSAVAFAGYTLFMRMLGRLRAIRALHD